MAPYSVPGGTYGASVESAALARRTKGEPERTDREELRESRKDAGTVLETRRRQRSRRQLVGAHGRAHRVRERHLVT